MNTKLKRALCTLFIILLCCGHCHALPAYTGSASIKVEPPERIRKIKQGVYYAPLDNLGRPTGAIAYVTPEMLSTHREAMSIVPPAFVQAKYDFIPAFNLYHRCHLIADQLGGEEIEENIFTGTYYLNIIGMRPYEDRVVDYVRETRETVVYQVTLEYVVDSLLCAGVNILAYSPNHDLDISVYCFNVQPGVSIDYRTGYSRLAEVQAFIEQPGDREGAYVTYYVNTNTKVFHLPGCPSIEKAKPKNIVPYYADRQSLEEANYRFCQECQKRQNSKK